MFQSSSRHGYLDKCWHIAYMSAVFSKDFGDGGAFPEIHVAQYPLEMGRKKKTSNALALQVDAEGKIKYDAIARQGQGKDKVHVIRKWHYGREWRGFFSLFS